MIEQDLIRTGRELRRAAGSRAGGGGWGNVVGRRRLSRYSDFAVPMALRKDSAPAKQSGSNKTGAYRNGGYKNGGSRHLASQ
ncbi:MAG TPA: hypothetical protein DCL32_09500 [Gammaproteobacteria bacterium]|nr:hypothetical protein [Gammaproteobacteria bacterium]